MEDTTSRALGQAQATGGADKAALKLYNVYRARKGMVPFAVMRSIEIQGDNLELHILGYCRFLSTTPVPSRYEGDLEPPKSAIEKGEVKIVISTTLKKYVGKALALIRDKFSDHPDFKGLKENEVPNWWTRMGASFLTALDRFHMSLGSDFTFGETFTRPLYRDNGNGDKRGEDLAITDYVTFVDLRYICYNLMKQADLNRSQGGKLQQRLWLAMLSGAVGRPGEIKPPDYTDWEWHPSPELLDTTWSEYKLLQKYSMPWVPSRDHYLEDIYHSLGCYWAVENGLFREDDPDTRAIANYVFPDLHQLTDAGVTKKITTVIRQNLPPGCPKDIANSFSGKSPRKGSITTLAIHRDIGGLEVCARSGHATGTSLDDYIDMMNVARGQPSALAIQGWPDAYGTVHVPRLECLGAHTAEVIQKFMDELFVVSIDAFKVGGRLYIVLRTCTASLIMYHVRVTYDLKPENAVSTALRNAARKAAISDPMYPNVSPEGLLDIYSVKIKEDFEDRNPDISKAKPDLMSISTVLNQQTEYLQRIMSTINTQASERSKREEQLESTVGMLTSKIHNLEEELSHANGKLEFIKTPQGATSSSRRRSYSESGDDGQGNSKTRRVEREAPEVALAAAPSRAAASSQTAVQHSQVASAPPDSVAQRLQYGYEAKAVAENRSDADKYISDVLIDLRRRGLLKGPKWDEVSVPRGLFSENSLLKYTLELVEDVITEEQRTSLIADSTSSEESLRIAKDVQKACMLKMAEYEGLDLDFEKKKSQKRGTYLAVGRRVREHKNALQKALDTNDKPPLQALPKATPGTPEDNVSVRKFMVKKNKK